MIVLQNFHYHVVFHVDEEKAKALSDNEIIKRWHQLFKGNLFSQRYEKGETLSKEEKQKLEESINEWRKRLHSISWFMRIINEYIARQANKEDNCKGRFWESRFKCQALLDDKALAACMAYVDLNPVRAKIAKSLETSQHTSIKKRIDLVKTQKEQIKKKTKEKTTTIANSKLKQPKALLNFAGYPRKNMPKGLPFKLTDYLQLVEQTGKVIRSDKRGYLTDDQALLENLGIESKNWLKLTQQFEGRFTFWVGAYKSIRQCCERIKLHHIANSRQCRLLFD